MPRRWTLAPPGSRRPAQQARSSGTRGWPVGSRRWGLLLPCLLLEEVSCSDAVNYPAWSRRDLISPAGLRPPGEILFARRAACSPRSRTLVAAAAGLDRQAVDIDRPQLRARAQHRALVVAGAVGELDVAHAARVLGDAHHARRQDLLPRRPRVRRLGAPVRG